MQTITLKTALLANALFSILSGLMLILFSDAVRSLIGIGELILYQFVGVGLLGFASIVIWTATRNPINTFLAMMISLADFLWVIGTLLVILGVFSLLQPLGMLILLGVGAIVLFFGVRQLQGIQEVYTISGDPNTQRLCVAVVTPASADQLWPMIADLPSIQRYSPNLTQVILRNQAESGVDAIRQCTDVRGKTWAEHCQRYDHQMRRVDFKFLADEPGFPYPFKTMLGGWQVTPNPNGTGSTVTIWFEVTPKYRAAHPIILAFLARNFARSFGELVARMTAAANGQPITIKGDLAPVGITSTLIACN
ncbi:MAG: SRPBCC family protein [Anaerolineae bacterium]|nr:SRPBCC family protein [Anaerolineae bacterium]